MYILSDPLIVIHHIFSMLSVFVCASVRDLGGLGHFVCGSTALELGTVWYNLRTLFDGRPRLRRVYWAFMTLSNLAGTFITCCFAVQPKYPLLARLFFFLTVLGLSIGRQRELYLDWKRAKTDEKHRKDSE